MRICCDFRDAGKRPGVMKRVASSAELVLDVEPKTQRVILKKKVLLFRYLSFSLNFLSRLAS